MTGPNHFNLPFFAYGVFRKGELGSLNISELVDQVVEPVFVKGDLLLRDGLPIIDLQGDSNVPGSMITFKEGHKREAYERINRLKLDWQYRWKETSTQRIKCNYLVGRSPCKGSVPADEGWDGKNDPFFTAALEVVQESLKTHEDFDRNLKPMFRLQMAYLLLWSSIERYASLRYHLGNRTSEKVMQITDDPQFAQLLNNGLAKSAVCNAPISRKTTTNSIQMTLKNP